MAYPVFDLHCDTADRIGWATLDLDLRFTAGTDGYFPGDETHPQDFDLIEGNACAISLAKIGNTPWAQCFATFVPDEIPTAHAARFQAQIMAHMSGHMVNVRSAADIRPALKDGKVACIHTIENATFFAEDPALIEVLKSLGVLMSSLSWNAQGPLASGHDTHAGLTAAGIEVTVEAHASATRDGRINSGDYEFALVGNGGWGNNPPTYMRTLFSDESKFSGTNPHSMGAISYSNAEMTALAEGQMYETDFDKRVELFQELELLVSREIPIIVIANQSSYSMYRKDVYDGWMKTYAYQQAEQNRLSYMAR